MLESAEVGSQVAKPDYEAQVPGLRVDLLNAQYDLRDADFPVLVLLAGDDRQGVNEVVHLLHEWMDARHLPVCFFGELSEEESQRPRFWRYWRELPGRGEMAVFLGGWAVRGVAERVTGALGEAGLERRLDRIARLERTLVDDGTLLLKFWIHLPKRALARRLRKARKDPERGWRVGEADWRVYELYDEAVPVVERLLRRTSFAGAPWHVVEGTDERHRNLAVARTLLSALVARLGGGGAPASPPPAAAAPDAVPAVLQRVELSRSLAYDAYRHRREKLQARLRRRVARLREQGGSAVLVFEGWDAAGKGGVIRRITQALDVRDYRVVAVGAPSDEERRHHYLWRFWRQLPGSGRLLIFDRSWYGRVLVERVEGFASEAAWRRAYEEIDDFEEQVLERSVLRKFWLHIDPEEQLRRFRARERTPYKKYKIGDEDYRNRERWDDYVAAVNEMVARTSQPAAPWHLVPANDKRWARVEVLDRICEALRSG